MWRWNILAKKGDLKLILEDIQKFEEFGIKNLNEFLLFVSKSKKK